MRLCLAMSLAGVLVGSIGCGSAPPASGPEQEEQESNETVGTERVLTLDALPADSEAADFATELYVGHDRKVAKTSYVSGDPTVFATLTDLIHDHDLFVPDEKMRNRNPKITRAEDSNRVPEEKHNVRVVAWIWFVKHERNDNDFHVILGSSDVRSKCEWFTCEVSGLPKDGPYRAKLEAARAEFVKLVGTQVLKSAKGGYVALDSPLKVRVEGSIFYDVDHPPGKVGPKGNEPKSAWEIHPVTRIEKN
jgi:hypothetical protein